MADDLKRYRVFIASPGGLPEERKAFRDVLWHYNEMDAMERGVIFTPMGWEIVLGGVGRPQELINDEIKKCDYFVLLLWDRWGSRPDLPGKGVFSSGTEEEFHVALDCLKDDAFPLRQIIVFFKAVEPRQINDPGPQLKAVLDFKTKLENSKEHLFHTFDEVRRFEQWIQNYLAAWVRDHENGDGGSNSTPRPPKPTPSDFLISRSTTERSDLADDLAVSSASPNAELLERAEALADKGRVIEAEVEFARALVSGNDPVALNRYAIFLSRLGRLDQARVMYERVLSLADAASDEVWQAKAYRNIGMTYRRRGELERAEEMLQKALAIHQKLGDQKGIAGDYGSLGLIDETRGKLDRAEELQQKALDINEQLGDEEGVSINCGNLGRIYKTRGELDRAEMTIRKGLVIDEGLSREDGMAAKYNILGAIFVIRGELDRAEELFLKALAIQERLGHQEDVAIEYSSLGRIYGTRGEWDRAEDMLQKALDIQEDLGLLEGKANQYANLGSVAKARGRLERAREQWTRARDLYAKIGIPHEVKSLQEALDELPKPLVKSM